MLLPALVCALAVTPEESLRQALDAGGLTRREYGAALSRLRQRGANVTGLSESAAELAKKRRVPEYTKKALTQLVNRLQTQYAKTLHMPREGRLRLAAQLPTSQGVAVLKGLDLEFREGSDTEITFRQESNMIYLTGFDHPGAKVIVGLDDQAKKGSSLEAGHALLFVPKGDPVWVGRTETLDDYREKYDVDDVFWIEDFEKEFQRVAPGIVHTFADTDVWGGAAPPPCAEQADFRTYELRSKLAAARVVKTEHEIEYSQAVSDIAVNQHEIMIRTIKCGDWESDAESIFRYVGHNYGARFQSYIPIVGSGPRAAALHYNDQDHRIPEGSLVLVDAAAEIGCGGRKGGGYTADVTRTFPCNGKFTPQQRLVYDTVFDAQDSCVKGAVVGATFSELSKESAKRLLRGLLRGGLLHSGTVDEMYAANIHRLFQPHGLGHSVGLDVHDPGSLSPLAQGMIITCEPGIYFYPSLLDPAYDNPAQSKYLNKELIQNEYITLGGVRIEDVVLVTSEGPENLSGALARTSDEIEALMAEGPPRH